MGHIASCDVELKFVTLVYQATDLGIMCIGIAIRFCRTGWHWPLAWFCNLRRFPSSLALALASSADTSLRRPASPRCFSKGECSIESARWKSIGKLLLIEVTPFRNVTGHPAKPLYDMGINSPVEKKVEPTQHNQVSWRQITWHTVQHRPSLYQ